MGSDTIDNLIYKLRRLSIPSPCSGLIELDTFVRENEHTNRGAYDREKT